jgi:tetratricopeptide (TPR) repeat protein
MADILDKEIERQKEHLLPQAIEEMNADDKQDQIKTWLERSRTLFDANQYDLALFAAEKVFLYDGNSSAASELIDQIKAKALKEGKADTLFIHKMYENEIADRLAQYRTQAEELAAQGQWGQAQFTAEKILMLEPEDPKALSILQKVLSHKDGTRSESL